jgi:hypothetical protein
MGLLDDLKRQADQVRTQESLQRSVKEENLRVVEAAMHRVFQYVLDLLKQLAVLKPVNPQIFVIAGGLGELKNLQLVDTFCDARRKKVNERDMYDHVDFYVKWGSSESLVIDRDMPAASKKVRDTLYSVNLKFAEDETKTKFGTVERTRFTVPAAVVSEGSFIADYDQRRVLLEGRNLLRLARDDFALPADDVNDAMLDEIGKMILGHPSELRRFRTVLPR